MCNDSKCSDVAMHFSPCENMLLRTRVVESNKKSKRGKLEPHGVTQKNSGGSSGVVRF